jgi:TRAP-type C4-dicarboxylate transport system permease small subunit
MQQPTDEATDALFREWEAQEAATRLDDIRPVDAIVFTLFWALFVVVFLQFFTRYVLNNALGWTEEIARYLLIGVCFVGSVMAVRKGTHITVEALMITLPERLRRVAAIAVDAIMVCFCALMTWHASVLSQRTNQYMVSIDVPKSVIYWGVTAAFAAMTLYAVIRLVQRLRGTLVEGPHLMLD